MGDFAQTDRIEWDYSRHNTCAHPGCGETIGNVNKTCKRHARWYLVNVTRPAQAFQAKLRKIKHLPGDFHIVEVSDLHGCTGYRAGFDRIQAAIEDYVPRLIHRWWSNSKTR